MQSFIFHLLKVEANCLNKVLDVYLYFHENIQDLLSGLSDRNEARVAVMHQKVTPHLLARKIIDAARSIRYVSHYHCFYLGG